MIYLPSVKLNYRFLSILLTFNDSSVEKWNRFCRIKFIQFVMKVGISMAYQFNSPFTGLSVQFGMKFGILSANEGIPSCFVGLIKTLFYDKKK